MSTGGAAPAPTVPARSCRRASPGDAFPSSPYAAHATRTGSRACPLTCDDCAPERSVVCYPAPTMAAAKLTASEIEELDDPAAGRAAPSSRSSSPRSRTAPSPPTQSDLSGDVGVDDESADAGTATFEREKDLSIEHNVRDLLQKIDRALTRIDAEARTGSASAAASRSRRRGSRRCRTSTCASRTRRRASRR